MSSAGKEMTTKAEYFFKLSIDGYQMAKYSDIFSENATVIFVVFM